MDNCIFCKISKGEIPSAKIWENAKFMAFLDIQPKVKGMTLVIPKDHKDSYLFNNSDQDVNQIMSAARETAQILKTGLNIERVIIQIEGLEVPHLHIKLLPVYPNSDQGKIEDSLSIEEINKLAAEILERN